MTYHNTKKLFWSLGVTVLVVLVSIHAIQVAEAARTQGGSGTTYFTASPTNSSDIYYNTGFVGIGTSSPNALLSVEYPSATTTPSVIVASSTGASQFTILANGNVGIATSSPYATLSVNGNGVFNDFVRASYFTATSTTRASTFPYASSTALTVSGNAYTGPLTISSLGSGGTIPFSIVDGGSTIYSITENNSGNVQFNLAGVNSLQVVNSGSAQLIWGNDAAITSQLFRLGGADTLYLNSVGMGFSTSSPAAKIDSYTTASSTNALFEAAVGKGGCLIIKDVGATEAYTQVTAKAGVLFAKVATSLTTCN